MQKINVLYFFKDEASGPYQGNPYESMTNGNRVNGGWIPDNKKKGGCKFKTISAIVAVLLAGVAIGAAVLADKGI